MKHHLFPWIEELLTHLGSPPEGFAAHPAALTMDGDPKQLEALEGFGAYCKERYIRITQI